jgi:hypothetical protein
LRKDNFVNHPRDEREKPDYDCEPDQMQSEADYSKQHFGNGNRYEERDQSNDKPYDPNHN